MIFAELLLFVIADVKDEHGVAVGLLLFFLSGLLEGVTEGGIGFWGVDVKAGNDITNDGLLDVVGFDAGHDANVISAMTVLIVYTERDGVSVGFWRLGGDEFGGGGAGGQWFVGILPKMQEGDVEVCSAYSDDAV